MATSLPSSSQVDYANLAIKVKDIDVSGALSALSMSVPTQVATNFDAGASGTAGTVDIFPSTAAKGKIQIAAANSAGDTTTTITNASQAGARTYTIPDAGASASFVMTAGAQTVAGVKTFSSDVTLGTGVTLDLDSATVTLSSNAATITKYAVQVTSEALTTAAGASQAFVLTLTGATATMLPFITKAGGTNTRKNYQLEAVMTTNTCTVTLYNTEPTNAINGTVIFNLWILKP